MRIRTNEKFVALRMESCDIFSTMISRFAKEIYISQPLFATSRRFVQNLSSTKAFNDFLNNGLRNLNRVEIH